MLLNVSHHLLLKRQVFKHRFNHQIAMGKTAVVCRAGDQCQGFITLVGLDMAAYNLLIKVLPAVLQRVIDSLRIDVFDTYRQFAFAGGNKRYSAPHQPTTQYANGMQRCRLRLAAGVFFTSVLAKRCYAAPETAASSPARQRLLLLRHSRCCCPEITPLQ